MVGVTDACNEAVELINVLESSFVGVCEELNIIDVTVAARSATLRLVESDTDAALKGTDDQCVTLIESVVNCERESDAVSVKAIESALDLVSSREADGVASGTIPIGIKSNLLPLPKFISNSPNSPVVRFVHETMLSM